MQIQNESFRPASNRLVAHQSKLIPAYLVALVVLLIVLCLLFLHAFPLNDIIVYQLQRVVKGAICCTVVLLVAAVTVRIVQKKAHVISKAYNLTRVINLVCMLVISFIVISFLNQNWYAAAVSLGLISLVLGFALQSPIASFIGWFYIILRVPYKVGDRIETGGLRGDVVEIGYLDTTLWEFGGDYMSNDLATGRLIRFSNSLIWQQAIYNYSWHQFPYIWNEIPFHIAYESDLTAVEAIIRKIYLDLYGDQMRTALSQLQDNLKKTPVEQPDPGNYPMINFRIHDNTWVEILLTYLVPPKESANIQTELIRHILAEFQANPEKVLFPKSNAR